MDRLVVLGFVAGIIDSVYISSNFPFEKIQVSTDGHKVTRLLKKAFNIF